MEIESKCLICQNNFPVSLLVSAELLSAAVSKLIKESYKEWNDHSFICNKDLNQYRAKYVRLAVKEDIGDISRLEEEVLQSIHHQDLITDNLNSQLEEKLTFGDKMADAIAVFGGSWRFILLFTGILVFWIILNVLFLTREAFDPYPFILLNLVLSCLAALQAPIIMMSQNRQSAKDRLRAESDYKVNLKAELEIRHLKAKLDQLASHQWRRLLEIQELQTELMEDIANERHQTKQRD